MSRDRLTKRKDEPLKPLTPIIHACTCRDCGTAFTTRYAPSHYCPECLIDRIVIVLPDTVFPMAQPAQAAYGFGPAVDALLPIFAPDDTPRAVKVALVALLGAAVLVILGVGGL